MRQFIDIISEASDFDQWFSGSKIVDDEGQPLRVYHGTAHDFSEYRIGGTHRHGHGQQMAAIYFSPLKSTAAAYARTAVNARDASDDGDGIVKAAFLAIKNPRIFDDVDAFAKADRENLVAAGYDGAIRKNQFGGIVEIAAFRPEQVRDAFQ